MAEVANWGVSGKLALPQRPGISPWLVTPLLIVLFLLMFRWFEKKWL